MRSLSSPGNSILLISFWRRMHSQSMNDIVLLFQVTLVIRSGSALFGHFAESNQIRATFADTYQLECKLVHDWFRSPATHFYKIRLCVVWIYSRIRSPHRWHRSSRRNLPSMSMSCPISRTLLCRQSWFTLIQIPPKLAVRLVVDAVWLMQKVVYDERWNIWHHQRRREPR